MTQSFARLGAAALAAAAFGVLSTPSFAEADLSGVWGGQVVSPDNPNTPLYGCQTRGFSQTIARNASETQRGGILQRTGPQIWVSFEQDCSIRHRGEVSKPMYKPQYWEEVRLTDYYANTGGEFMQYADPSWWGGRDMEGVPRMGSPNQIVHGDGIVVFLYAGGNRFRIIPTDCRDWDPLLRYDQSAVGLSVGCWVEDSVLEVKTTGFTDQTWLSWNGYIHSDEMIVTETFELTPEDDLIYNVWVHDPVMFLEDWHMTVDDDSSRNPQGQLFPDVPYIDRSLGALSDPAYRG